MTLPNAPTQNLGGYRLVRKLGAGVRSEIYLGVGTADEEASRTVALKLFRPDVARTDMTSELATLARLASPHCVRLMDVATGPDGTPVPILRRVQRGSVAQLLSDRESLEAGEAVTLLAPVAEVVAELHARGIAHGGISARSLHLGAAGEPVLLGFGHAHGFAEGLSAAALDELEVALADRRALATLSQAILSRIRRGGAVPGLDALLTWLEDLAWSHDTDFTTDLTERLFGLAEPIPIEFAHAGASGPRVPARIGMPDRGAPIATTVRATALRSGASGTVSQIAPVGGIPRWLDEFLVRGPIESARNHLLRIVRGVRRPLWIVAGAILLALVAAVIVVPRSATGAPQGASNDGVGSSPSAGPSTPSDGASSAATVADDPVAALPGLLKARARCIRELSVLCLTTAEENSSAAATDDGTMIRRIQAGQQIPSSATITATSPALVERLGDSALVALNAKTGPVSALLIKGEAGWRIRAFLTGQQVQP